MSGEHLDLSSQPNVASPQPASATKRPFVGVHFACCVVYARVYINRSKTAYLVYCPKCGKRARLTVGPGGTDQRIFTAY